MQNFFKTARPVLLVTIFCVLSVSAFFRYQIENHFTHLLTDRFDGMIVLAILEHWHNVFRGNSSWSQTNFFYPVPGTLGYQDAYLANGVFYSCFRSLGVDPFLASELANMVLRSIAFVGAYLASRRVFGLGLYWALLSAILFTLSNASFVQANHVQLFSICFAPLMVVLLHGTTAALLADRRRALLAWGLASTLIYAIWLMTGYYMAWYFLYFTGVTLVILVVIAGKTERQRLWIAIRRQSTPILVVAVATIVMNLPFLSTYLPKVAETGQQPYGVALSMTPSLLDIPNVGPGNWLWGDLITGLRHMIAPDLPPAGENTSGMPLVLLFLFGCTAVWVWQRRSSRDIPLLTKAMVVAVLLTWATVIHIRGHSLWFLIYHLVPGAKSLRAVARYQIFLTGPVIALTLQYLYWNARKVFAPILVLICILLVVEQVNITPAISMNREEELARLRLVPQPPANCKVFFASASRPEKLYSTALNDVYSHNVDSMFIAEYLDLPTMNGFGAFVPPGWNLIGPDRPDYLQNVESFAEAHDVTGLCGLNLRTMRWNADPKLPNPSL